MDAFRRLQARLNHEMESLNRDVVRRKALDLAIAARFETIDSLTAQLRGLVVPSAAQAPEPSRPAPDVVFGTESETSAGSGPGVDIGLALSRIKPRSPSAAPRPPVSMEAVADYLRDVRPRGDGLSARREDAYDIVVHGVAIERRFEELSRDVVRQARENAAAGTGRDAMKGYVGRHRWRQALYLNAYDAALAQAGAGVEVVGSEGKRDTVLPPGNANDRVLRMLADLDFAPPPPKDVETPAREIVASVAKTSRPPARQPRELRWLNRYGDVAAGLYAKLKVLDRPAPTKELKRMLGWSRRDIQKTLEALLKDGHVRQVEPGVWALPT